MTTCILLLGDIAGTAAPAARDAGLEVTLAAAVSGAVEAAGLAAQRGAHVVVVGADGAPGPAREEVREEVWEDAWAAHAGASAAGPAPILCYARTRGEAPGAAASVWGGADAVWDVDGDVDLDAGGEGAGRAEARLQRAARAVARAAARRRRAWDEAERERERVERFAYAVAHDVKGRLQGVVGLAGLLSEVEGPRLSAEGRDWLARVEDGGASLARTLERMLLFLRVERRAGRVGPVDWEGLVRARFVRVQEALAATDTKTRDATLTVRGPAQGTPGPARVDVDVDEGLLALALDELLDNAIRFGGEGGARHVHVAVELRRGPGGEPEARGAGEAWALVVEDDGPGLPPSLGTTALEPLERGIGGGDGLGLAIVARVAQALGGAVTVETARAGGSGPAQPEEADQSDGPSGDADVVQGLRWPEGVGAPGRGCRVILHWGH